MQVLSIKQQNSNPLNEPKFKGGFSSVYRFLATNQAIGANAVDLGFMVLPRTGTDLIVRGPAAGLETGRREASGTTNHSLIGLYGSAAGIGIAALTGINKKFGTNINSMFVAPETLNILAENNTKQVKDGLSQIDYLKETLANLKAYNPTAKGSDKEGFVKLSKETVDDVAEIINNALDKNITYKTWSNKKTANSLSVVMNKIIADTGAESKYILETSDKKITSDTTLKTLLKDLFQVSESFNKEEVKKAFKEQVESGKLTKDNVFIKKVSKFMKNRSLAGFIIGSGIGMSIQPLNIYLTKRKTGTDGFVGVEGRSKDNSTGFKILKVGASAGFFGLTLATLGTGLKGFMDKMAFKGLMPTISQLKGIYGLTIISRLLAARDKDELRESFTKDTLGFLSWLVLGDFVNRITAELIDKSVMNRTEDVAKKGFFKRVYKSSLKTRDEILIETLAKEGVETLKKDGDKTFVKKYSELSKELNKLPEEIKKVTKKRLRTLNCAQSAGYLFSGLVLGLGIPNLNIYITNTLDKKRKAKQASLQTNS